MIWEHLDKKLIKLHQEASSPGEVFEKLGECFIEEREAQFPTGLDINGFGVAIPHTDAMYVLRETEGIMTLKEPVRFTQMGSDDTPVDVKVVFMLAIENPQTHIKKLQQILRIIQDDKVLEKVYLAETQDDVINIIKQKEIEIGGETL